MNVSYFYRIFFVTIVLLNPLSAKAVDLGMPIDCSYGTDCFIQSYFDHSPEEEKFNDHTCGDLSSDGHATTDFKLLNYTQMKEGVDVLAGDEGVVTYVRDGMSDISISVTGEESVRGKECGNGLIIEHKRGYTTQYCHLKQNSIIVAVGDKVEKGQKIGQVGLSGLTDTPFLEFKVSKEGKDIDPFTGEDPVTGDTAVECGSLDIYPLWDKVAEKKLKYIPTALLSTGFARRVPHALGAREGKFNRRDIYSDAKFMVFWVDIFGIIKGDRLELTIIDPSGKEIATESRLFNASKQTHFQFLGKKPDQKEWPVGTFKGRVRLIRKDVTGEEVVIDDTDELDVTKNPDPNNTHKWKK